MTELALDALESPANYEQKCLCVLVLDTSGSMQGDPIKQLNDSIQQFKNDILTDFVASQRLEICIVTFDSSLTVRPFLRRFRKNGAKPCIER